jgi:hypothetical protein
MSWLQQEVDYKIEQPNRAWGATAKLGTIVVYLTRMFDPGDRITVP